MTRKRKSRAKTLATLDFETDPFMFGREPEPFTVGLYTGEDYWNFWGSNCVKQVVNVIKENNFKIYAHNGGKFDFFFMLPYLDPALFLINGRIARCTIGENELLDSYLILPLPLSAYAKDEIDYSIMEREVRNKPENKAKILDYLQKDCIYLHEWVTKFEDRFGKKLTVAQTAFDQLDKSGYPCKRRSSKPYDDRFRKFYYGGRTQAFKTGVFKKNIKVYDINSAYPYAMLNHHPFGTDYKSVMSPKKLPDCEAYFAHIIAKSKGALPIKVKQTVSFPSDNVEREYFATGWEIRAGLETNTLEIISIKEVLIHDETRTMKSYVTKFYAEKLEGKKEDNKDKVLFSKLMLNSAYGKFGADPTKYKKSVLCDWDALPLDEEEEQEMLDLGLDTDEYLDAKGWKLEGDTAFGKSFWSRPDPGDSFFNVAVAASITGWVRAYLWRAICNSEGVLYCDTDSIMCEKFNGEVGDEIGAWDFEGETKKGIYIGGKKLYTMELVEKDKDGNNKIKKAHKGARLSHEQIIDIVEHGKVIEWENMAPSFSLSAGTRFVHRKIKATNG